MDSILYTTEKKHELQQLALIILPIPVLKHYCEAF